MAELEHQWSDIGQLRIHARVSGGGPPDAVPLVLVHGVIASSRYLLPTAALLAPDYRVFVPDLPGYGKSSKPVGALQVTQLADALLAWMEANTLDSAVLFGNSFGCQIIVDLAVRHPSRVSGLILVGPTVDPRAHAFLPQAAKLVFDLFYERPSLFLVETYDVLQMTPWRAFGEVRAMLRDRIEEKLPNLSMPVLVVRGGNDPIVPQRWVEEAASMIPNARLATIPGAPHAVNYSSPAPLAELTREFMNQIKNPVEAAMSSGIC
ncbi:MAG: alpha/beta hydrolase [Chloroflexota bacterium]